MKKAVPTNVVSIGKARESLKPGDIVQLLTGGPKMVVGLRVKDTKGAELYVDCYWINDGIVSTGGIQTIVMQGAWSKVFPIAVLKRVKL
jgi:uncharacterized protein YodC (DUF2158 family)